jgi:hypothetical protein
MPKSESYDKEIKLLSAGGVSSFRFYIAVDCMNLSNGILSDLGAKS